MKDPAARPVTFAFNGGPGGAAVWVHFGAFGPRRVEMRSARFSAAASRPAGGQREFDPRRHRPGVHRSGLYRLQPPGAGGGRQGVPRRGEGHRVGGRLHPSLADPQRAAGRARNSSPARATARSAPPASPAACSTATASALNGVILISTALNGLTREFDPGNDMPFITFLPTYTAAAWYHKKLAPELMGRPAAGRWRRSKRFALDEYGPALLQGDCAAGGPAAGDRREARPLHRPVGGLRGALQPASRARPLLQGAAARPRTDHRPDRRPVHRHRPGLGGGGLGVRSQHDPLRRAVRGDHRRLPAPGARLPGGRVDLRAPQPRGVPLEVPQVTTRTSRRSCGR